MKRYVEVTAHTNTDGKITPVVLWWDRDHSYEIDKVLDSAGRPASRPEAWDGGIPAGYGGKSGISGWRPTGAGL